MNTFLDKIGLQRLWGKIKALIPTKVSELENDSGYLNTQVQTDWEATEGTAAILNKPDIERVDVNGNGGYGLRIKGYEGSCVSVAPGVEIFNTEVDNWFTKQAIIRLGWHAADDDTITLESKGSDGGVKVVTDNPFTYNNKEVAVKDDIPTVPTKTSDLTNDSGFLTEDTQFSTIGLSATMIDTGIDHLQLVDASAAYQTLTSHKPSNIIAVIRLESEVDADGTRSYMGSILMTVKEIYSDDNIFVFNAFTINYECTVVLHAASTPSSENENATIVESKFRLKTEAITEVLELKANELEPSAYDFYINGNYQSDHITVRSLLMTNKWFVRGNKYFHLIKYNPDESDGNIPYYEFASYDRENKRLEIIRLNWYNRNSRFQYNNFYTVNIGGSGGDANVIKSVKVNGTALTPDSSKAVDIQSIPAGIVSQDGTHRFVSDTEKDTWNNKSDFSGSYNDLSDKPTIPAAVTESTVSGWGFTKNTGTYSKPSDGIPSSDLATAVQNALTAAGTALQPADLNMLNGKVAALESLVSEGDNPTAAIDKFNEIVAFLANITNTDTLNGILNGINEAIAAKYTKPSGGIPKNDLATAVQTSLGKADTALQSFTESDPTVPSHVKSITTTDISNWNSKVSNVQADWNATSGDAVILNKPTIPTKTSQLTNDSNFLTEDDVQRFFTGTQTISENQDIAGAKDGDIYMKTV